MKYIDINQKFTAKVAEYIAKGYTINTATMSGSQGEVTHVDLTDGKQVVRVLLDSFTEYDSFNSLSGLEIVVGTPADKVVPYDTVRYNTIWNNRLEVIESERFYEIGSSKRRGNTFYGTKAEAEQAEALSVERYKAKSETSPYIDLTDRYLPLAVSIVKKRTGCTRVQKANVRMRTSRALIWIPPCGSAARHRLNRGAYCHTPSRWHPAHSCGHGGRASRRCTHR